MGKRIRSAEAFASGILLVIAAGGRIYGVAPFGTPMFCALACGTELAFTAPVFLLCEFLFSFEVRRLYTAGAAIFIMGARFVLGLRFKPFRTRTAKTLCAILAIIADAALSALFVPVTSAAAAGFISLVFYYFAERAGFAVRARGAFKPDSADAAAFFVVSIVAGLAFARAYIGGIRVGLAPAAFLVLLACAAGTRYAVVCGAGLALGLGLSAEAGLVPAFLCYAFTAAAFFSLPRIICALISTGVYAGAAVLFYFSPVDVGWSALMLFAGALPFLILPKRAVARVRAYFDFDGCARLAVRHYINRNRADAGNRMLALAAVFDETARLLGAISSPPPDPDAVGLALSDRLCPYCARVSSCDTAARRAAFSSLAAGVVSGRPVIAELPEFFTRDCARTSDVINAANELSESVRRENAERETEDRARALVTEQLSAVKDVMEELARTRSLPVGFDGGMEERIIAELSARGIECAEALFTRESITAVIRSDRAVKRDIEKAVRACTKRRYEAVSVERMQAAGWSVATLKKRPAYEAVYARAGVAKDGISGDSYTFKRLENRFLVALLDGMGSGEAAGKSSGAAVELIECFYRAGFDSRSAMTAVNRFLKGASASYSAADVAVLDLDTAAVDIIKIGSPPCYIRTEDTVLKIEGSSLPIGVLDEMRPYIASKRLYPGQMLVLVTDGVSDCFSGDELPELINNLSAYNPEKTVNAILSRALELGEPRDDMTAIAVRLYDAPGR